MQTGFVTWAGFDVVATYGRPETLTGAKVAEIVTQAKAAGVALVIDNLQSGPEAGKSMAQDIGAVQVTISNFPGGLENTETWEKAIDKNIELLLAALAQYQKMI
jgi:zinc transport system substrate-binding protein